MTCEFERDDGAYVLGALPPAERLAFERHLPQCADCRLSLRQLAGLPGLLAQVSLDDLDPTRQPPVPRTLQRALIDDIRRSQRRRTLVVAGIAASAAAGLVSAAAVGLAIQNGGSGDIAPPVATSATSTAPAQAMTVVGHAPLRADVAMASVPWGTRLDVTCAYGTEQEYPTHLPKVQYALVVRTTAGGSERVATWWGIPGKTMQLSAATATARGDITAVEMRTSDGTTVARLVI